MLTCKNVIKQFGGLHAVDGLDLSVAEGNIHGLIGPNGSGKTTFFNMISGLLPVTDGSIVFNGQPIQNCKAHSIARLGIARTFQHIELFKGKSVLENVLVGAQCNLKPRLSEITFNTKRVIEEDRECLDRALDLLDFIGLIEYKDELATTLPYGNQRLVEVARALATQPKLLLLDEPAAGMNNTEKEYLISLIKKINDQGTTVIVIEHDIRLVSKVASTITVLDAGKKIAEGTADSIQNNQAVIKAYLGEKKTKKTNLIIDERSKENAKPMKPILEINNLNTYYGHVHALTDVSFTINQGEYVALIGTNGAGKTTLLKSISGVISPRSGEIRFNGAMLTGQSPDSIVDWGVVQVPEGRGIFPGLTVLENLKMGAYLRKDKQGVEEDIEQMFEMFPRLKERIKQLGGSLSGGEQQMLALSRAVMSKPKLLLLDEPSMGLAPILATEVLEKTRSLYEMGITILLVEQNAQAALEVADRAIVMEIGTIAMEGSADELMQNDSVRRAYLGIS